MPDPARAAPLDSFCPATMCPLTAPDGSPWTGEVNALCDGPACGWFGRFGSAGCGGAIAAQMQADMAAAGRYVLQIGPVTPRRAAALGRTYQCPRAHECQWQREAGDALCPPRSALARGLDPRITNY